MTGYCMHCGRSLGVEEPPDSMCDTCRENAKKGAGTPVAGGWECPRCGKILAPWMAYCDCPQKCEATYSSTTEDPPKEREGC